MKWYGHEMGWTWNGTDMKWDWHEVGQTWNGLLWHELGQTGMKWDGHEMGRAWIRTVGHDMGLTWNGTGMKWPGMNWPAWIGPTWNGRAWNGINPVYSRTRDAIISNHLHQWVFLSSITLLWRTSCFFNFFVKKEDVGFWGLLPFFLTLFCAVHKRVL